MNPSANPHEKLITAHLSPNIILVNFAIVIYLNFI